MNLREFPVTIYGEVTPYNEVLSKARCRIFYKYLNRNGAYITDDFADKLVSSLPYAPVKGIYNVEGKDYTDHGAERDLGRIYGIVPEKPNGRYEKHLDEDGKEREYYCADVLLFTALYKEAKEIVGKSQSMELYPPSIKGQWRDIDGEKAYVYTEGCFLGLQVLGDEVEPCFEGAAFYTLSESDRQMIETFKKITLMQKQGGLPKMGKINFKLSDASKHDLIWSALNPNFNEENDWAVDASICDVYDDYALVYYYADQHYERVYYTKNEDDVTIDKQEAVYILDVSEPEKAALEALRTLNGGTFEKAEEVYSKVDALTNEKAELATQFDALSAEKQTLEENFAAEKENFEQKKVEDEQTIATLQTENEKLTNDIAEFTVEKENMTSQLEALQEYQKKAENEKKQAIVSKYATKLPEEALAKFERLEDFDITQLEKELAFELVNASPAIFELEDDGQRYVQKDQTTSGLTSLLNSYKNGGNNQ